MDNALALLNQWDSLTTRFAPLLNHASGPAASVASTYTLYPSDHGDVSDRPDTPDLQASSEFIPVSPLLVRPSKGLAVRTPLGLLPPTEAQLPAPVPLAANARSAWSPPASPDAGHPPPTAPARVPLPTKLRIDPPMKPSTATTDPWPRLHRAATVIQAAWRGFRVRAADIVCASVRREIRTHRAETHISRLNDEVAVLQARLRAQEELRALQYEAIKVLWDDVQALKRAELAREDKRRQHAAVMIQKHWRACCARKTYGAVLRGRVLDSLSPTDRRRAAVAGGDRQALVDLVLQLQHKVTELSDIISGAFAGAPWGAAATLRRNPPRITLATASVSAAASAQYVPEVADDSCFLDLSTSEE